MNSYHEDIFKILIIKDINTYFEEFKGDKGDLKELIDKFVSNETIDFKEEKDHVEHKKCIDRSKYGDKDGKCLARIWNNGRGCQCSFTGKYDGFCKKHSLKGRAWWLGTIDLPRPERPINHKGKVHTWLN